MSVGMVVDKPVAEPEHAVEPEIARQPLLDLRAGQRRVAIGVQQALFGRDREAGAIPVHRAALQDPVSGHQRQSGIVRQLCADGFIAGHPVFFAPAVEAEASRLPCPAGLHHQRPGIAQPDIAECPPLQRDPAGDQSARMRFIRGIADQQANLLAAFSDRIGEGGDLLLSAGEMAGPFFRRVRETDPQPVLRRPFGWHRHAHELLIQPLRPTILLP